MLAAPSGGNVRTWIPSTEGAGIDMLHATAVNAVDAIHAVNEYNATL